MKENNLCCILSDLNVCRSCGRNFGCEVHIPKGLKNGPLLCYSLKEDNRASCWKHFTDWETQYQKDWVPRDIKRPYLDVDEKITLWIQTRKGFVAS
jgi:hypothetical protein